MTSTELKLSSLTPPAASLAISRETSQEFFDVPTEPIDPSGRVSSLSGRTFTFTNSSDEPHTPRKNLGADGLEIFSPTGHPPSPVADVSEPIDQQPEVSEELPQEDIHETIEKTNYWATLCFGSAIAFTTISSYYLYRSVKERNLSLLIPVAFWGVVATVIGTAGEIIQKTTKLETPTISPALADQQKNPYLEGQPIALQNTGNTCFVNAPTQAIMNSTAYPRVFKQICERGKIRHSAFKKFLELYPSWHPFSWPKSQKKESQPFTLEDADMRHVLVMLSLKKSSLKYDSPEFKKNYPELYRVLGEFSKAKKEADYISVVYDLAALNLELSEMKKNRGILLFFYAQRTIIAKELLGFDAYFTLIKRYETAVAEKKGLLVLSGWLPTLSSSIGNVRYLLQGVEGATQEDVHEFLHCLAKYVLPEDYPEVFFTYKHQQLWKECPVQDQVKIERAMKMHTERKSPNDILTQLDEFNNTISKPEPCCILKIEDPLTEGADGQKLINSSLGDRNPDNHVNNSATVFLNAQGVPRMFYPQREKFVMDMAPEQIILQLKRFEYTADGRTQKKDFIVNMPEEIKIDRQYYELKSGNVPQEIKVDRQYYELKSVVIHTGSSMNGHYHALVKKKHPIPNSDDTEEKWWYASDSCVQPATAKDIKKALTKGYLYFYEKKPAPARLVITF